MPSLGNPRVVENVWNMGSLGSWLLIYENVYDKTRQKMVADLKVDVLDVAAASTSDVEEGEAGCGTKVDVAYAPSLDGVVRRGNAFTATFKIFIAGGGASFDITSLGSQTDMGGPSHTSH